MSFTSDIKQEIANVDLPNHCQKAQLSALIQLTSSLSISNKQLGLIIRSENPTTAKRIVYLLKELYKVETRLEIVKKTNLKRNNVYTVAIDNVKDILDDLGIYTSKGLQSHPRYEMIMKNCCAASYISGCFLAYGSCNNPVNSNYHFEISLPDIEISNFVIKIFSRFEIEAKTVKRRSRYVVYVKKADYISDCLALLKAHDSMMRFEDERIGRDLRNSLSRIDNCEIANEVKTFKAASRQVEYMQKLIDVGKYDFLNEKLKNVVDIRMKYQDYSLLELCDAYQKSYGDSISKSGMKHRLNKLENMASALED